MDKTYLNNRINRFNLIYQAIITSNIRHASLLMQLIIQMLNLKKLPDFEQTDKTSRKKRNA